MNERTELLGQPVLQPAAIVVAHEAVLHTYARAEPGFQIEVLVLHVAHQVSQSILMARITAPVVRIKGCRVVGTRCPGENAIPVGIGCSLNLRTVFQRYHFGSVFFSPLIHFLVDRRKTLRPVIPFQGRLNFGTLLVVAFWNFRHASNKSEPHRPTDHRYEQRTLSHCYLLQSSPQLTPWRR